MPDEFLNLSFRLFHPRFDVVFFGFGHGLEVLLRQFDAYDRFERVSNGPNLVDGSMVLPHGIIQIANGVPVAALVQVHMLGQPFGQSRLGIRHQHCAGGEADGPSGQIVGDLPPTFPACPRPQRHKLARRRNADERFDVSPDGSRAFVLGAIRHHRRGQSTHRVGGQIHLVGFRVEHPSVQGGMRCSHPRRLFESARRPPIGVRHSLLDGLLLQLRGLALMPLDA